MLFWILGFYFAFAGFLMYVLIMGQSRFHRDGYVGALSRIVQAAPSNAGRFFFIAVCCNVKRGTRWWTRIEHRVMLRRHPTLQLFYIGIMAASYWAFFSFVYPLFPPNDTASRVASIAMAVLAIAIFLKACWTDPGVVKTKSQRARLTAAELERDKAENAKWDADGTLFPIESLDCATCGVPKPPRSKHCRVCDVCVRRYDHHCAWLNQDVGQGNMVWFHAFLTYHTIIAAAYFRWSVVVLMQWIRAQHLWGARYTAHDGHVYEASWRLVLLYVLTTHPAIVALAFFAALVAVMLFVFWISHFRNAMKNLTSNEAYKIDEYRDLLLEDLRARRRQGGGVGPLDARPRHEKEVAEMVKEAEAAFSLGSWWLNVADSFGFIQRPAERRRTVLQAKRKTA